MPLSFVDNVCWYVTIGTIALVVAFLSEKWKINQCFLFSVQKLQNDAVCQCIKSCRPPGQIGSDGFLGVKTNWFQIGRSLEAKTQPDYCAMKAVPCTRELPGRYCQQCLCLTISLDVQLQVQRVTWFFLNKIECQFDIYILVQNVTSILAYTTF